MTQKARRREWNHRRRDQAGRALRTALLVRDVPGPVSGTTHTLGHRGGHDSAGAGDVGGLQQAEVETDGHKELEDRGDDELADRQHPSVIEYPLESGTDDREDDQDQGLHCPGGEPGGDQGGEHGQDGRQHQIQDVERKRDHDRCIGVRSMGTHSDEVGMNIDDAVVISLPERTDRLKAFYEGLPNPWPFPWPRLASGVLATPPPSWRVSAGAYGCALAHVAVIEQAWRRGVESLLVLEDDALFAENFAQRWTSFAQAVPPSWSLIMLGGQHHQPPVRMGRVSRCVATGRTHAYIIRARAMPLVIRTWRASRTHIDHALPQLQARMPVFAPSPLLVGQRAGLSDISNGWREDRMWDGLAIS